MFSPLRQKRILIAAILSAGAASTSAQTTVASWVSPISATWTDPTAWSTNPSYPDNGLPLIGPFYDAIIEATGAAYTVTLPTSITLNSLNLNSPSLTFVQTGGALSVVADSTFTSGIYQMNGGTFAGAGGFRVSSTFNWTGGTFASGGSLNLDPTAILSISGNLGTRALGRVLNNSGRIDLGNTSLNFNNGTLNNLATGSINLNSSTTSFFVPFSGFGSTNLVSNAGTINTSNIAGASVNFNNVPMTNSGSILCNSGTLHFGGITFTHENGSYIGGNGFVNLGSNAFNTSHVLNGTLTLGGSNMSLSGGTFSGSGNLDLKGSLAWSGGTLQGSGSVIVEPTAILSISGNFSTRTLSRVLNNSGRIDLGNTSLNFNNGTLNNLATGSINLNSSTTSFFVPFSGFGATNLVNNAGTINTSNVAGASVNFNNAPMTNSGSILCNSGSLHFGGITFTHENGSYIGGNGFINLGSNAFNTSHVLNGTLTLAGSNMALSGGTFTGAGNLDLKGSLAWSGGTLQGSGSVIVEPAAVLSIAGNFTSRTLSRVMNNSGRIDLSNTSLNFNGGTLNNLANGSINLNAATTSFFTPFSGFGSTNLVSNAGTINTSNIAGASVNFSNAPMTNSGSILCNSGSLHFGGMTFTHENGSYIGGNGFINLGSNAFSTNHLLNGTLTLAGTNMAFFGGSFSGAGNLDLKGSLAWSGGTFQGTGSVIVEPTAVLSISGSFSSRTLSRVLNNSGRIDLGNTSLNFNGGTLNNLANGSINLNAATTSFFTPFSGFGPTNLVNNAGTINTSNIAGGSVNFSNAPMTNSGSILCNSGSLHFGAMTFTHENGSYIGGNGFINLGSNAFNTIHQLNGTLTLAGSNMAMFGGTFTGAGNLDLRGRLDWSGGTFTGAGSIVTPTSATIGVIAGPGSSRTLSRVISNSGSLNFDFSGGGSITLSAGTINNTATGTMVFSSTPINYTPFFDNLTSLDQLRNDGTILITTGVPNFTIPVINAGTINANAFTIGAIGSSLSFAVAPGGVVNATTLTINAGTPTVQGAAGATAAGRINIGTGGLILSQGTLQLASSETGPGILALRGPITVPAVNNTSSVLSTGLGSLRGTIDLGGTAPAFDVGNGNASVDLLVSASLTNGTLRKTGLGLMQITSPLSIGGGVSVVEGTLILSGGGSFTGGIAAITSGPTSGAVQVDSDAQLGAAANVVTLAGGTFRPTATFSTSRQFVLGINANGNGTFDLPGPVTFTINSAITGVTGLTKTGIGTLNLTASNSYTGPTSIQGGTLLLSGAGDISPRSLVSISTGAALDLGGVNRALGSLAGDGLVALGAASLTVGGNEAATTFSGAIVGSGGIIKSGPGSTTLSGTLSFGGGARVNSGTLILSGSNTFSGGVQIAGGTLRVASDENMGAPGATINFSGGTLQSSGSFVTSRAMAIPGAGGAIDASGNLIAGLGNVSGTGTFTKTGAGLLVLTASNSFAGTIAVSNGGGTLTLAGSSGALSAATLLKIALGGRIELNNTVGNQLDRLSDTAIISFNGGDLVMLGANSASSSELLGPLSLLSSMTTLNVAAGAGGTASLSFASIQRSIGASINITGTSIGTTNKVLLRTTPGAVGAWLKVNGLPAKYDAIAGLVPTSFPAPGPSPAMLWGDANLDGVVNGADYALTLGDFGLSQATWADGDFNGDRAVNQQDLNLLLGNLPAQFVPEPGGLFAITMIATGFAVRRKRKVGRWDGANANHHAKDN